MGRIPPPTGDHKGTQPNHPTALAPTESWIDAEVDAPTFSLLVQASWAARVVLVSAEQGIRKGCPYI